LAYTPHPDVAAIPIKSVAVTENGTTLRVTPDLQPNVSQVIQLRINADKLVGARGEKIDTNGNLVAGEPEDDLYYNLSVTGPSVTPIVGGTGATRNPRLNLTGAGYAGLLAAAPVITFPPNALDPSKYDVEARLTWNFARNLGGLDDDTYIKQTLDAHFIVQKYDREGTAWTAVSGAWTVNSLGQGTFTATVTAEDFDIFRLNLKGRKELAAQGEYFGFKQKLSPVYNDAQGNHYDADEQQVAGPIIPNGNFMTTAATITGPNWINDKGGWLNVELPAAVLGVDPATLVKENFRLYAASGNTAADVLNPVRGIPVDSVSQYLDGNTVHIIIKLDPNYKKFTGGQGQTFANRYQVDSTANGQASQLQVWIGNVKVYLAAGVEEYLGSTGVLRANGLEDFFGLYGSIAGTNF
jgi:hypothetical protein